MYLIVFVPTYTVSSWKSLAIIYMSAAMRYSTTFPVSLKRPRRGLGRDSTRHTDRQTKRERQLHTKSITQSGVRWVPRWVRYVQDYNDKLPYILYKLQKHSTCKLSKEGISLYLCVVRHCRTLQPTDYPLLDCLLAYLPAAALPHLPGCQAMPRRPPRQQARQQSNRPI